MSSRKQLSIIKGEIYCIPINCLYSCSLDYVNFDENNYSEKFCGRLIRSKKPLFEHDAYIFIKYLYNGIFEEMETGKKVSLLKNSPNVIIKAKSSNEEQDYIYEDYTKIAPVLNHIYKNPLVTYVQYIEHVSKKQLLNYEQYSSDKIVSWLEVMEETARIEFHDSLKEFVDYDYNEAKADIVWQKVKKFKNRESRTEQ